MAMKLLEGIRVIDFGQLIAGARAAGTLAALGADVIKVEPVKGESARHMGPYGTAILHTCNRDKRSIALDLRSADGATVARELMHTADVVIQNMRPGTMERIGLGARAARELNPRLVYATATGFGPHGPSRDRVGLDIVAQAESGMMSITGEAERDPMRVGFTVVDMATSELLTQAILAALFARERTGQGDTVEVSLLEVALHLQGVVWAQYHLTGAEPTRSGSGQPTIAPAADVVWVKDGAVIISAYWEDHWRRLCTVLERPELAEDQRFADNDRRVANREQLLEILGTELGGYTQEETVAKLSGNGIIVGAIRDYNEVWHSADVQAADAFQCTNSVEGETALVPRLPFRLEGWKDVTSTVPGVGEHSIELLNELGYSSARISSLLTTQTIAVGEHSAHGGTKTSPQEGA